MSYGNAPDEEYEDQHGECAAEIDRLKTSMHVRDVMLSESHARETALQSALTDALRQRDAAEAVHQKLLRQNTSLLIDVEQYKRERDNAVAQVAVMRDALSWSLDILDITDAFLKEQLPASWAKLNREADATAKAKARQALSSIDPQATAMLQIVNGMRAAHTVCFSEHCEMCKALALLNASTSP